MKVNYSTDEIIYNYSWKSTKNMIESGFEGLLSPCWNKSPNTKIGYESKKGDFKLHEYFIISGDGAKCLTQELPIMNLSHKYYVGVMFRSFDNNNADCLIRCNNMNIVDIDLAYNTRGKWRIFSYIYKGTKNESGRAILQINNQDENINLSQFVMIDLTETFGKGNEPSKNWCDNNIRELDKLCLCRVTSMQ